MPIEVTRSTLRKKERKKKKKDSLLNLFLCQNFNQNVPKVFKSSSGEEYKLQRADLKNIHLGQFFHPKEILHAFLHHLMPQLCTKYEILHL